MKTALLLAMLQITAVAANFASAANPRLTAHRAWEKADANGDGSLSREEARRLPRLARQFELIDRDGNGVISGGEVRAWRDTMRAGKRPASSRGIDEILRIADRDGDGALSRAEFVQGLPRHARRFDRIDTDGSGILDRSELSRWLESLRGRRR